MGDRPSSPAASVSRLEIRAAVASLVVSLVLLTLKFTAYVWTGSTAIFSDALESIVNVFASAFALYALRLAHAPADREHPYGHGKIEFMSAGFEGGLVLAAALAIAIKAVLQLVWHGTEIEALNLGLVLIGIATAINALVGVFLLRLGRRNGSMALEADGRHLFSDALTSVAAIAALVVVRLTGWKDADPIAALLMGLYIAVMGVGLLRRSAAGLMDEQDAADARLLQRILDGHVGSGGSEPRICSYHKLRHRHVGRFHWVDFHIMLPPRMSIEQGHDSASRIEGEIERALGEGDATAHIEPCADGGCELCRSTSDGGRSEDETGHVRQAESERSRPGR